MCVPLQSVQRRCWVHSSLSAATNVGVVVVQDMKNAGVKDAGWPHIATLSPLVVNRPHGIIESESIHKLMQWHAGPFNVIAAVNDNAFKIEVRNERLDKGICNVFNVSLSLSLSQLKKNRRETPHVDVSKHAS